MPSGLPHSGQLLDDIRGLPLPIAMTDRELRLVAWSDAWAEANQLTGLPLDGRSYYELFPETSAELRAAHQRCLGGACESLRAHGEGGLDVLRQRISPWRDAGGEVIGLYLYCERLAELAEARQQLQERESFNSLLFERSSIGMNLCRLDGLWLESNPAFLEIIGYSRGEADGHLTYWEVTPREYDEQEALQLEALQTSGRYGPYEKEFIRKDGSRVPVRLNGFMVERDGERYIWSLIEDISERKGLEAQVAAERMKAIEAARLAALGELAAGVAHEINNPLAIIEGYLETLRHVRLEGDPALFDEALERIGEANRRAAQIVSSLRKIARQDRELDLRQVRLLSVVDETLDLYSARFRNRGIDLRLALDADAEVCVRPNELSQVLINLLNNAFQALKDSEGQSVELRTELRPQTIALRVTDSGSGVPAELRERVFDPFFTTKEIGQGTGLGLSIARSLIIDFGGHLTIDPDHAQSSFLIELPRARDADV